MILNHLKNVLFKDSKLILESRWKFILVGLMGILYWITWAGLIHEKYIPVNRNLLIGERIVGRASIHIEPAIPILSPYGYDSQFFWARL